MNLALRIDDIGASSKQYEVHSKSRLRNIWFLKSPRLFGSWGPYQELTIEQWKEIFDILRKFNAKLTVAVTAGWVEKDNSIIPFPEKFPAQASVLKEALKEGLVEIANHGLTHSVVGRHLPKLFGSNREYHREFWPWLDERVHYEHMEKSQKILQAYFQTPVTILVPPGNVFSDATVKAAEQFGINLINCHIEKERQYSVRILDNDNVFAFHDRELVIYGIGWLRERLERRNGAEYCFVSEL